MMVPLVTLGAFVVASPFLVMLSLIWSKAARDLGGQMYESRQRRLQAEAVTRMVEEHKSARLKAGLPAQ